jgi:hypothetical protein
LVLLRRAPREPDSCPIEKSSVKQPLLNGSGNRLDSLLRGYSHFGVVRHRIEALEGFSSGGDCPHSLGLRRRTWQPPQCRFCEALTPFLCFALGLEGFQGSLEVVNDNGGHIAVILCRLAGLDYAFQGLQYFLTLRRREPSVALFTNDLSGDAKPSGPEARQLLLGLALSSLFGFLAL